MTPQLSEQQQAIMSKTHRKTLYITLYLVLPLKKITTYIKKNAFKSISLVCGLFVGQDNQSQDVALGFGNIFNYFLHLVITTVLIIQIYNHQIYREKTPKTCSLQVIC